MATTALKAYSFTVVLAGVDELTVEVADAVYGSGIDDALLRSEGPTLYLDFEREAESLGDAIGSAVKDVERAGFAVARVDVSYGQYPPEGA
jgi:hypothetical protein